MNQPRVSVPGALLPEACWRWKDTHGRGRTCPSWVHRVTRGPISHVQVCILVLCRVGEVVSPQEWDQSTLQGDVKTVRGPGGADYH